MAELQVSSTDESTSAPPSGLEKEGPPDEAVQLLEAFIALMPDAALVVDEAGRIVSLNEKAEALFGYAAGELVGRKIEVLVPERYRYQHRRDRAAYLQEPRARPMGAGLDLCGRRRDGSEFPVDISLAPLTGTERPLAVAAVRDVSERRAASAAQAQLAAIVQSSSDGIVSMSVDGVITTWNPGAEALFGYRPADAVGHHISMLVPDDASGELEELLADVMAGGTPGTRDTEWLRQDGSRLHVALSVSSVADAGGDQLGFSALVRDVTERKRAEAELRRVLAEERLRKRQQEATAEIRLGLLSGTSTIDALTLICSRAGDLLETAAAAIVVVDGDELRVEAGAGRASHMVGRTLAPGGSLAGRVVASGESQIVAGLAEEPYIDPRIVALVPAGPALGVVISGADVPKGAMVLSRDRGAPLFRADDVAFAAAMAEQAALAFALSRARRDREDLMLARDRERIARDLHDLVIQRLFATGMGLEGVARLSHDQQVVARVSRAVEDLDTTIREIRNTIFALETGETRSGLRADLLRLCGDAAESLGFEPVLRFEGPVDAAVPRDVAAHVLAVVREGLSNAARHASASRVDVTVRTDGDLLVTVIDDGVGLGDIARRSGLANLRQRADDLGGRLDVDSAPGLGTRVAWRVPLPE